jgi:hypothetical protein
VHAIFGNFFEKTIESFGFHQTNLLDEFIGHAPPNPYIQSLEREAG